MFDVAEAFTTMDNKQILNATVLDIYYPRMQYSTRLQAEWNITIPRVVISLISNTVKVQYLFYCTHYTYKIVSGL